MFSRAELDDTEQDEHMNAIEAVRNGLDESTIVEGAEAHAEGLRLRDNPYFYNSPAWRAWTYGWCDADMCHDETITTTRSD